MTASITKLRFICVLLIIWLPAQGLSAALAHCAADAAIILSTADLEPDCHGTAGAVLTVSITSDDPAYCLHCDGLCHSAQKFDFLPLMNLFVEQIEVPSTTVFQAIRPGFVSLPIRPPAVS
jgi:hypothetical protein